MIGCDLDKLIWLVIGQDDVMSTLIQVATNWLSRKANLLSCDIYVGDNVKFILEITRTKISQMMKEPNSLTSVDLRSSQKMTIFIALNTCFVFFSIETSFQV